MPYTAEELKFLRDLVDDLDRFDDEFVTALSDKLTLHIQRQRGAELVNSRGRRTP